MKNETTTQETKTVLKNISTVKPFDSDKVMKSNINKLGKINGNLLIFSVKNDGFNYNGYSVENKTIRVITQKKIVIEENKLDKVEIGINKIENSDLKLLMKISFNNKLRQYAREDAINHKEI